MGNSQSTTTDLDRKPGEVINTRGYPIAATENVRIPVGNTKKYSICRCWKSAKFPYCDNTHQKLQKMGINVGPVLLEVRQPLSAITNTSASLKPISNSSITSTPNLALKTSEHHFHTHSKSTSLHILNGRGIQTLLQKIKQKCNNNEMNNDTCLNTISQDTDMEKPINNNCVCSYCQKKKKNNDDGIYFNARLLIYPLLYHSTSLSSRLHNFSLRAFRKIKRMI